MGRYLLAENTTELDLVIFLTYPFYLNIVLLISLRCFIFLRPIYMNEYIIIIITDSYSANILEKD